MASKRTFFTGKPIIPKPIPKRLSIPSLVDDFFQAYNAGRIREACRLYADFHELCALKPKTQKAQAARRSKGKASGKSCSIVSPFESRKEKAKSIVYSFWRNV
jgi:hypothetical protein